MTTIRLSTVIPAAPRAVYDYVTRPVRWKEWHPSSQEVQGVDDEPLVAGRRFEEDIVAGGRARHLTWLVEESRQDARWRASAYMADGSTVRLCYEFTPEGDGTRFTRTLEYVLRPALLRWLNDLFLWRRVERESAHALEQLRSRFAR